MLTGHLPVIAVLGFIFSQGNWFEELTGLAESGTLRGANIFSLWTQHEITCCPRAQSLIQHRLTLKRLASPVLLMENYLSRVTKLPN